MEDTGMKKEEMVEYLESTGLYEDSASLFYEKIMMESEETIPISDLVERFISTDKEYNNEPWNIKQILANINLIVPVEHRNRTK